MSRVINLTPLVFFLLPIVVTYGQIPPLANEVKIPVTIHTDFEAGNLGKIEKISETHWRCGLAGESDWDQRNRQASWYYFRLDGAKNLTITIELIDLLGEYNYRSGTHAVTSQTRPVVSYDQIQWRHLTDDEVHWSEDKVELHLQIRSAENSIWIAHQPPYTTADLQKLGRYFERSERLTVDILGQTPQGRNLEVWTATDPAIPNRSKKVIWLMARQHAWESGTSWVMESIVRHLLETVEGSELMEKFVFKLIPMADPDGVARGGVRFNEFGHDLNRNWDLVKPAEMPEIFLQKNAVAAWLEEGNKIDFFLTLHNTESVDYLQGPDLMAGRQVWKYMVEKTSFEAPEGLRTLPGPSAPGRMTVYENLWTEFTIPAYLMELKVERVTKLNRQRTLSDWRDLGPGLLKSIAQSLE